MLVAARTVGSLPSCLSIHLCSRRVRCPWCIRHTHALSQEEIFGPCVTIAPFDGEAGALALANDSRFGLGAAVWTRDVARAHRVAQQVRAGIVWINAHHRNDPSSPWGGYGQSGVGRENGWDALYEYTLNGETINVKTRVPNEFLKLVRGGSSPKPAPRAPKGRSEGRSEVRPDRERQSEKRRSTQSRKR